MASNGIKKAWTVCGSVSGTDWDERREAPKEFKTLKAALARAKYLVQETENTEAWIYVLSHVVSRPPAAPVVDVVK